jgi:hypothetical protein
MKKINLIKLETLTTAEYPQEDKYPSGNIIKKGLMWNWSKPEIDKCFYVYKAKLNPVYKTSLVQSIQEIEDGYIITTINSRYKIEFVTFLKNE